MPVGSTPSEKQLQNLALAAFEEACDRLSERRHSVETAYAPAAEALFWTSVCDEGYEAMLGETVYRNSRDADTDGSVVLGVRWARDRMTHQRALVVEKNYGSELGSMVVGRAVLGTVDHMKWALAGDIPPGRSKAGQEIYKEKLQGRAVSETIEACRRWFNSETLSRLSKTGTFVPAECVVVHNVPIIGRSFRWPD